MHALRLGRLPFHLSHRLPFLPRLLVVVGTGHLVVAALMALGQG